jgi:hypothetical protein
MNTEPTENNPEANSTVPKTVFTQRFNSLNAQTKRGIVIALIVFLALIVFGFIASRSLPGDALYSVKTDFIEELDAAVQWGPKSKAEFYVRRMESRLAELKALAQKDQLTEHVYTDFREIVEKQDQAFTAFINEEQSSFSKTEKLIAIESYTNVAAAMETLSEGDPELQELGEFMEDIRREAFNLYKDEVDRFVEQETPANIYEFIKERLTEVSNALNDESLSEGVIDDAEVYINRVSAAMADSNYPRAIAAIAEAHRFIVIEKYGVFEATAQTQEAQESATTSTSSATTTQEESSAATPDTSLEAPSFTFPQ